MMAHNLHNIIFELTSRSIERKDVFMKRQPTHHIHKLLLTALPFFILILILPLTSQATPYVYTYTDNLFTSTNSGPGNTLEATGKHVSVQFTCDGDLSALNQTQTFELSPPNIANIRRDVHPFQHLHRTYGAWTSFISSPASTDLYLRGRYMGSRIRLGS